MNSGNSVLWITGHSRGGAVANLVAKKMGDLSYDTYTYTFATPNVTTDPTTNFSKYDNIFNLVNEDDLIPKLPLNSWEFDKYGKTKIIDVNKNMKGLFQERTKIKYKGSELSIIENVINEFSKIAEKRNDCYVYTCVCHSVDGKQEGKSITVPFVLSDEKKDAEEIFKIRKNKLSNDLKLHCKFRFSEEMKGNSKYYYYYICETPMYFMNQLAIVMGGTTQDIRNYALGDTPEKYETSKWSINSIYLFNGIAHPHFADAYIILSE